MNRLIAPVVACGLLAACSVSLDGPCSSDAQCTAPATCDVRRNACVLPCEPKCGVGELCIDRACVQQGPVVKSVTAPSAWSTRTGTLTVTAAIDDGQGPGTASAALHIPGQQDIAGASSDGLTWAFQVPATSAQAQSHETPVAFTIDAIDKAGHATLPDAVGTGQLLIDDAGATLPSGVTVNGGVTASGGIKWFPAGTGNIDVQAVIADAGSGVKQDTLALMEGATRLDVGAPACTGAPSSLTCHFTVPQSVVPAGSQRLVHFAVAGTDVAGNPLAPNSAALGIDGKPPVITFTIGGAGSTASYPPNFADCNGGATDSTMYCGHDGAHFWRAGDGKYSLTFTVSDAFATPDDVGSGPDPAGSTCSIAGSSATCTVTFDAASGKFGFPANFAGATFSSGVDGSGTVSATVAAAKDLVGNTAAPVTVSVDVTRVKWMRSMAGKVDTLKGSPVVTNVPTPQIIVAGAERDALGAIASLAPDGSVLWRAGHGDSGTISNNVAYSSSSQRLYVTGEAASANKVYAYDVANVAAATAPKLFTCTIDDGSAAGAATGAPAILGGAPERILVADSGEHRLWAFAGTSAGCAGSNPNTNNAGAWVSTVKPPTTDGTNIYLNHDTKLSSISFNAVSGAFTVTDAPTLSKQLLNNIAIAGNLFFADVGNPGTYYAYDAAALSPNATWTANAANNPGLMADAVTASAIVGTNYVFGEAGGIDGHLHAFDRGNGGRVFQWPVDSTNLGTLAPITLGADGAIYLLDSTKELVPLKVTSSVPGMIATWGAAPFKGSVATIPVSTAIDSVGTEPTIDSRGVLYFGTLGGKVYALITDSGGPLVPTPGSTWPRVGYDNCNSSNTAFSCQ